MHKKTLLFTAALALIVFVFFTHTLNYPWRYFDEDIIFKETILPIANSLFELKEIISSFGTNYIFESSNPIYSNISNMRGNPIWLVATIFIFYLLKSSAFNYHLLNLILHISNTILLFLILRTAIPDKFKNELSHLSLAFFLTLLWSLHPVNIESVLFATNFGALITYLLCFIIFYYYMSLQRGAKRRQEISLRVLQGDSSPPLAFRNDAICVSFPAQLIIFIIYFFALAMHEYAIILPIVIFAYTVRNIIYKNDVTLKTACITGIKNIKPLIFGLIIFSIYFFSTPTTRAFHESSLPVTLERIFWLAPQIFFHYLKLIFFPNKLSVDHASLIDFPKTLIDPYSIFCFLLFIGFLYLTIKSFLTPKNNKLFFFFITFSLFLIALLPCLHIITPMYNIVSERYLYFPLFILIFGFFIFLLHSSENHKELQSRIVILLAVMLFIFGNRAYLRTLDWKNSKTLLTSAIESTSNYTYKGLRTHMLANSIKEFNRNYSKEEVSSINTKALLDLREAFKNNKLEKVKYQSTIPEVLKYYGLDPETMESKTAYLIASIGFEMYNHPKKAVNFVSKYLDNLKVIDSQILRFYYRVLFFSGQIDKAENLINKYLKNKVSHVALVAYSDLLEYKHKNLEHTEKYLKESFKLFPYDSSTLFGLKRLYKIKNDPEKYANFAYLYGLRTHDLNSLKEAAITYLALNKKEKAKKIIELAAKSYVLDEDFKKIYVNLSI